jgi:hypothetical protein
MNQCPFPANFYTFSATDTTVMKLHNLLLEALAFRVVTPAAAKGTALQKNCGTNSWTIMYGVFLNVEYQSLHNSTPQYDNIAYKYMLILYLYDTTFQCKSEKEIASLKGEMLSNYSYL